MNYIEYTINNITEEQADILVAELCEVGFDSFSEYDFVTESICCYIPEKEENRQLIDGSLEGFNSTRELIEQRNWNAEWESNFSPIQVGEQCYIRAAFHEPLSVQHEIVITPKMSFGTGHHPTTHLMVEFMLGERFDGMQVLDMGSGTGILAILAAQRGAAVVDAIDVDEWAYENCLENIVLNGVQTVVCPILGDVSAIDKLFDAVLANINRNILLNDMHRYFEALREGGKLFVSGILEMDVPVVASRAAELGLTHIETKTREGWAAIAFAK